MEFGDKELQYQTSQESRLRNSHLRFINVATVEGG